MLLLGLERREVWESSESLECDKGWGGRGPGVREKGLGGVLRARVNKRQKS